MIVSSRLATPEDLPYLLGFYRSLEKEQLELRPLWDTVEGLPEPIDQAFTHAFTDDVTRLVIGELDGVPLGFALATLDDMLPQGEGARVVTVRYIYTDPEARGVGIGHAMVTEIIDHYAALGVEYFDAKVSPGHRNAKNFFEAHGFSARLIVMHHRESNG
jgi:GNAT superfamily N-acetyltransferase